MPGASAASSRPSGQYPRPSTSVESIRVSLYSCAGFRERRLVFRATVLMYGYIGPVHWV
jgi:hypothetical protein